MSFYLARRMTALARAAADEPAVAYLCLWTAFSQLVNVRSRELGVRPNFGLRRNGTLRTLKVGGRRGMASWKMPEVIPPREARRIEVVLSHTPDELKDRMLRHPVVSFFVARVPTLQGRPVLWDAYGQRPLGILDVAATVDPRYPVWHPIDGEALQRWLTAEGAADEKASAIRDLLLGQVVTVLQTINANLLATEDPQGGDENHQLAAQALPLLNMLVEGLMAGGTAGSE